MIPILTIIICLGSIIGIVIYISKTEIKSLDNKIMKIEEIIKLYEDQVYHEVKEDEVRQFISIYALENKEMDIKEIKKLLKQYIKDFNIHISRSNKYIKEWDKDRYEFKFKEGNWRWTRIASNNRIVGASSEGYRSKYKMLDNAKRLGFNKEIHRFEFV